MIRRLLGSLALVLLCGSPVAGPALAQSAVDVRIPDTIRSGFVTVAPAPGARKYVIVEDVVIRNPSTRSSVSFKKDDFSLVVGTVHYHPQPRPGLGAVDLSNDGGLGPSEVLRTNLAFIVPIEVTRAKLEFLPANWYDDNGRPVVYCCYPG